MAGENEPLDELAAAVLDGQTVDWRAAESSAEIPQREAVRQLRVLAGIAEIHRSVSVELVPATGARHDAPSATRWGRFELLETIGRGSFGDVYRARDTKLDREVAVKLLHSPHPSSTAVSSLGEARLLARVRHPNVVTVYDAGEIDGRVGLWMEFVHGRALDVILREHGPFDPTQTACIGVELCRALAAVHEAGLLHRDVKAQNVMKTDDGRLVLMDFGTGRDLRLTPLSAVDAAGTPLYLAPEIFGGASATVQSDLYGAGVLLFHLLTGRYPVRGGDLEEIRRAHILGRRDPLPTPGTPRALVAAIERAIEPDPARRFESAREMLAALEPAAGDHESASPRLSGLITAIAALAVVAMGVVAASRSGDRRESGGSSDPRPVYFGSAAAKRSVHTPAFMIPGKPSPDGRFLPYSELGTGNLALYEFATGSSRTLTNGGDGGDENYASESVVSADGLRIAYDWEDSACRCTQLRVIDIETRDVRVLHGERDEPAITVQGWFTDGTRIVGTRKQRSGETEIVTVAAADGFVRVARTLPASPAAVTISPDGRWLAYDRPEDAAGSDRGIYLSPADGGTEVPLVTGLTYDAYPLWTADGAGLVFASMRTGGPGLWLQRLEGARAAGSPRLLDKDMGPFAPIALTHDGSLFYDHRTGLMDVFVATIDPATAAVQGDPVNAANRFMGSNLAADWSPDGATLTFASWRTLFGPGRNVLVFHSTSTGAERELELELDVAHGVRWSPDGRSIAIDGPDRKGVRALRLIDPNTGRIESSILEQAGEPPFSSLEWDPDGVHAFLRRAGRISRADVRTGEEDLVFAQPAAAVLGNFSVSPDGRWLAFGLFDRSTKHAHIEVISTRGGDPRDVIDIPADAALEVGDWTRDGQNILFTQTSIDAQHRRQGELWSAPFAHGEPRRLGLAMRSLRDVRLSPDGARIAFTSGFPDRELWVFERFLPDAAAMRGNEK